MNKVKLLFRKFILKILKPVIKASANWYIPYSRNTIKLNDIEKALDILEVGDIILTTNYGELSNILNFTAKYKHASMYLGNQEVIEATSKGVHTINIYDLMYSETKIAIVRCNLKDLERVEIPLVASKLIGKPYDLELLLGSESYYCSELVYSILNKITNLGFKPRKIWGELTIVPDDFYNAKRYFKKVYEV